MVIPDDGQFAGGFETLLLVLSGTGVEQYIVPDELVGQSASVLARSSSTYGLVLSHSDVLQKSWVLPDLPTTLLVPRGDKNTERLWQALKVEAARHPNQRFVVVASSDAHAEGRPLQQIASKQAPVTQDVLETLKIELR